MARSDTRYRAAFNGVLDLCGTLDIGAPVPTEEALSLRMNVSRTVIRRCLTRLQDRQVISWVGRDKRILRHPVDEDRVEITASRVSPQDLEQRFLDWILRFDVPADTPLSVAELSRTFGVAQHELKEFLAGLSRFGLVARREQGGWMLRGFTRDFAIELSDFRMLIELNAVQQAARMPDDHPVWPQIATLRASHLDLQRRIDRDFHEFSKLDETFHKVLNAVMQNRFVAEFQKVISLIFHYHFMWDKTHEKIRNAAAIKEHLAIIDALLARDAQAAHDAARTHLTTSKLTLLSSLRHHDLG